MKTQNGRELTAAEMATMLDEWVNANNNDKARAEFAEHITSRTHRTLQQGIMRAFVAVIEAWAEGKGGQDARNEATVKLAKKFVEATGDKYDRHLPLI